MEQIETEPRADELVKQVPKVPNGALQNGTGSPDSGHPSSRNFSVTSGLSDSLSTEDSGVHEPSPRSACAHQPTAVAAATTATALPPGPPQSQSPQAPPPAAPTTAPLGASVSTEPATQPSESEGEALEAETAAKGKEALKEEKEEAGVATDEEDSNIKSKETEKEEGSKVKDSVMETKAMVTEERKIESVKEQAAETKPVEPEESIKEKVDEPKAVEERESVRGDTEEPKVVEELAKPAETEGEREQDGSMKAEAGTEVMVSETGEHKDTMEAAGSMPLSSEQGSVSVATEIKDEATSETDKNSQTEEGETSETGISAETKDDATSDTEIAKETQEDATSAEEKPEIKEERTSNILSEIDVTWTPIMKTKVEPSKDKSVVQEGTEIKEDTPLKNEEVTEKALKTDGITNESGSGKEDQVAATVNADESSATEPNGTSETEESTKAREREATVPTDDDESGETQETKALTAETAADENTAMPAAAQDNRDSRGDVATGCEAQSEGDDGSTLKEAAATQEDALPDAAKSDQEVPEKASDEAGERKGGDADESLTACKEKTTKEVEEEAKDAGTEECTPAPLELQLAASAAKAVASRVLEAVGIHQPEVAPVAPDSDESPTAIEMEDIPTARVATAPWEVKPTSQGTGDQMEALKLRAEERRKRSPEATGMVLSDGPDMENFYPQLDSLAAAAEKTAATSSVSSNGNAYSVSKQLLHSLHQYPLC